MVFLKIQNNNIYMTHYQYLKLEKQQLIKLLVQKQKQLQECLEKEACFMDELRVYQSKLEEQIEENQKSIKTFAQITEIALKAVQIFNRIEGLPELDSRKSSKNDAIMKMIRNSGESVDTVLMASFSEQASQVNYMEQIIEQTTNVMEYIVQMAQSFYKSVSLLKEEVKTISDKKKQIQYLNKQIQDKTLENGVLKKVLKTLENQKLQILHNIDQITSTQFLDNISNLTQQQLIVLIKKLAFRVKELENEKKNNFKEKHLKNKEDIEKYQEILTQLKQHKKNFSLRNLTYNI